MPDITQSTGRLIDTIKINHIRPLERDGRQYWLKERQPWSRVLIPCANAFFRAAANPVRVLSNRREWQQWEIDSYHLLHGAEDYHAFAVGEHGISAETLPGISLEAPASEGWLSPSLLAAAARELKRAHQLPCPAFGGGWSHADPHVGNFIFDEATGRARLIDFEVTHLRHLTTAERHADDLLIVFQCLMSYTPLTPWQSACASFLAPYLQHQRDEKSAQACIDALRQRLTPPHGITRLWWAVRTGYIAEADRDRRIAALHELLDTACP